MILIKRFLMTAAAIGVLFLFSSCGVASVPEDGSFLRPAGAESSLPPEKEPVAVSELCAGVTISSDGVIDFGNRLDADSVRLFSEILGRITGGELSRDPVRRMILGGAVFDVSVSSPGWTITFDRVTALGQTAEMPVRLPDIYRISAFETDGCFVFQIFDTSWLTGGTASWVFGKNGVFTHSDGFEALSAQNCADSMLSFYKASDERLEYRRTARKYYGDYGRENGFLYCVSRNESACVCGRVTFDGAKPVFLPAGGKTAAQITELESCYLKWQNAPALSFDAFLAENAEKYPEFK